MRVVLLAGGKGTRLRPFTASLPKPLVPLGDVPVIEILVEQLREHGITEVTVVTGHLAELIRGYLGDGRRYGLKIDYFEENAPLDTAGCLGLLERPEEPFMVMNGDLLTTLNFRSLAEYHHAHQPLATIGAFHKKMAIDLGVLEIDRQGRLLDYREKPFEYFNVSMGVYCFDPRVVDYVRPGERLSMPELILRLRDAGETVLCYQEDCYWLDIGRPADYALAEQEFCRDRSRFLSRRIAA